MKKFLSILLVAMLIISMIPATVSAAAGDYELVTNVSNLAVGDKIVIVSTSGNKALGTKQNSNNRSAAAVTINSTDKTVTFGSDTQVITLEEGSQSGTFSFYVEGSKTGYLYAAGGTGSNNYMRTASTKDAKASWKITITAAGVATIKTADTTVARHTIKYNSSSTLFSCYASGQVDVSIYKLNTSETACDHAEYESKPAENATCTDEGKTAEISCSKCGEVITAQETIPANGHTYVGGACSVCGEAMPVVESETYIFQDYPAGVQYAVETHVLSDIVSMHISKCHLHDDNLRIYSSSSNNGIVIIESLLPIKSVGFNAGNNTDTLNIYGSDDGESWTLLEGIAITSTSYNDYTSGEFDKAYTWLKLDVAGANQIRLESLTLNFEQAAEEPSVFEDEQGNGYDTVAEAIEAGVTVLKAVDEATEMPFDITVDGKRYIGLEGEDGFYSYYTLELKVSGVALRASEAGIYYYAKAVCDDALAGAVDSYGIVLSANDMPTKDALNAADNAATQTLTTDKALPNGKDDKFNSGSVFNILKDGLEVADNQGRGVAVIYAVVYLEIDGEYVISTQEIKLSLKGVLELINTRLGDNLTLNKEQNNELYNFYQKWAVEKEVINGWNLDKIAALTLMQ